MKLLTLFSIGAFFAFVRASYSEQERSGSDGEQDNRVRNHHNHSHGNHSSHSHHHGNHQSDGHGDYSDGEVHDHHHAGNHHE